MHTQRVVLVSGSPRRKSLLEAACFDVRVWVSQVDEIWPGGDPGDAAVLLAGQKLAAAVAAGVLEPGQLALAADTVVVRDDDVLGKPQNAAEAVAMLRSLAGRAHQVITGFVARLDGREVAQAVVSQVSFRALTQAEIEAYVAAGESLDKAGAYGIQGAGGALVDHVDGSYPNIVGLPVAQVLAAFEELRAGGGESQLVPQVQTGTESAPS